MIADNYFSNIDLDDMKRIQDNVIQQAERETRRKTSTVDGRIEPMKPEAVELTIPAIYGACELSKMNIPALKWIIPDILPQGVTLLSGKEKGFKSYFALGLCMAVSSGSPYLGFAPEQRIDSLYIDLESSLRRPRDRIAQMGKTLRVTDNCHILSSENLAAVAGERITIDNGFVRLLDMILDDMPQIRLIVIDVYIKVRGKRRKGEDDYEYNYRNIAPLKELADRRGIAIILVHHTIRGTKLYDDPFDTSRGVGLNESVDTLWMIARDNKSIQSGTLMIRGRDLMSQDYLIRFDPATFMWQRVDDPETVELARVREEYERSNILQTLEAVTQFSVKWDGTPSDLIRASKKNGTIITCEPKQLGMDINKYAPFLLDDGFTFSKDHKKSGSVYIFTKIKE